MAERHRYTQRPPRPHRGLYLGIPEPEIPRERLPLPQEQKTNVEAEEHKQTQRQQNYDAAYRGIGRPPMQYYANHPQSGPHHTQLDAIDDELFDALEQHDRKKDIAQEALAERIQRRQQQDLEDRQQALDDRIRRGGLLEDMYRSQRQRLQLDETVLQEEKDQHFLNREHAQLNKTIHRNQFQADKLRTNSEFVEQTPTNVYTDQQRQQLIHELRQREEPLRNNIHDIQTQLIQSDNVDPEFDADSLEEDKEISSDEEYWNSVQFTHQNEEALQREAEDSYSDDDASEWTRRHRRLLGIPRRHFYRQDHMKH